MGSAPRPSQRPRIASFDKQVKPQESQTLMDAVSQSAADGRHHPFPQHGVRRMTYTMEPDEVDAALDYVKSSERRFRRAYVTPDSARALCDLRSVAYTVEETRYLSVAEVAVAAAQLAQVHVAYLVTTQSFDLPIDSPTLAERRRAHEIVFADFYARCARPVVASPYVLSIRVDRTYLRKGHIFARYEYEIADRSHTGRFLAHTRPS